MNYFLLDASALCKRYAPEPGTELVDHLFSKGGANRLKCLMLGAAEVVAALVRKRNAGKLDASLFGAAMNQVKSEILDAPQFAKLTSDNALIGSAIPLLTKYPLNASDGVFLQAGLEDVAQLRNAGHNLVVVASDQRLLKAAQAEGLPTFDPETQTQAELDKLLAS